MMLFDGVICFLMCVYIPPCSLFHGMGGCRGVGRYLKFLFCMHVIRTFFMFMNKKLPQRGVALEERAERNQGGEYTLTLL